MVDHVVCMMIRYVFLREKNLIFSDNEVKKRYLGGIGRQGRLGHIKRSMARLLTVVSERKKVRDDYRRQLEDEYVAEKRTEYTTQVVNVIPLW